MSILKLCYSMLSHMITKFSVILLMLCCIGCDTARFLELNPNPENGSRVRLVVKQELHKWDSILIERRNPDNDLSLFYQNLVRGSTLPDSTERYLWLGMIGSKWDSTCIALLAGAIDTLEIKTRTKQVLLTDSTRIVSFLYSAPLKRHNLFSGYNRLIIEAK